MSDLIEKLLQGEKVEWKTVEDVFILKNGYTPSKAKSDYWINGTIPWFRMEDLRANGGILNDAIQKVHTSGIKGKLFPANSIIMSTTATIGEHALITVKYLSNQQFTNFTVKEELNHRLNVKFIYYYFFILDQKAKQDISTSSFPSVQMDRLKAWDFPIPPLSVQAEIVRILDAFTAHTAELTAELSMRQKQYNHYRDTLLTFQEGQAEWKTLGEVANIKRGKRLVKSQLEKTGKYAVYQNSMTPLGYYHESNVISDTTFIISAGAAGEIGYCDIGFWAADDVYYLEKSNNIKSKFLYYLLLKQKDKILAQVRKASIPRISRQVVEKIKIPIPPLAEQERIVSILDKFDILTNSITEGLPREIALRQQQYEYYREQLLNFPKP